MLIQAEKFCRLPPDKENAAVILQNGSESKLPQETDWCSIALAAGFAQTRFTAASERVREKLRLRLLQGS